MSILSRLSRLSRLRTEPEPDAEPDDGPETCHILRARWILTREGTRYEVDKPSPDDAGYCVHRIELHCTRAPWELCHRPFYARVLLLPDPAGPVSTGAPYDVHVTSEIVRWAQ